MPKNDDFEQAIFLVFLSAKVEIDWIRKLGRGQLPSLEILKHACQNPTEKPAKIQQANWNYLLANWKTWNYHGKLKSMWPADQLKAKERSWDILVSQLEWPTGQLKNLKKSK